MSSTGRNHFLPVLALLLVFLALSECYREKRRERKRGNNDVCVHVKADSRFVDVATCRSGEKLQSSVHELKADVQHLEKKVDEMEADVSTLQGNNTSLRRVFAFIGSDGRRFCEINTLSEAEEICKLALGITNPNPHYAHIPCGPGQPDKVCPRQFWRVIPGCFRPNGGLFNFFKCFISPTVLENCTQPVLLSCDGFTQNIAENYYRFSWGGEIELGVLDEFTLPLGPF